MLAVQIAKARPAWQVRVIGDGVLRPQIEAEAAQLTNLTFSTTIPHSQVGEELAKARLSIVSSSWSEPFGRVAAESLAAGTPALVSARGGLPEIVAPVSDALVVAGDRLEHWLAACDAVLALAPVRYYELAERCLGVWRRRYSMRGNALALERVYREVLAAASAA